MKSVIIYFFLALSLVVSFANSENNNYDPRNDLQFDPVPIIGVFHCQWDDFFYIRLADGHLYRINWVVHSIKCECDDQCD